MERILKAPPERVFDAFTDPDELTKWWWPKGFTCPAAEVDLRVGGQVPAGHEVADQSPPRRTYLTTWGGDCTRLIVRIAWS